MSINLRTSVEFDGVHASVDQKPYSHRSRKSRVFVSVSEDEIPMDRPPYGSSRGDGSAEDALWQEYNKLEKKAMREKARKILDGLGYKDVKLTFSRTAGCSCPCSPGFVADRLMPRAGVIYVR